MRNLINVLFLILSVLLLVKSAQADPPIVIEPIQPIVVDEDCGRIDIVNLNDIFVDPDGRQLVFSIQNAPRDLNMEIDRNGMLFFEPSEDYNIPDGIQITIVAANEQGEVSETRFPLVVVPVNDCPVIGPQIEDVMVDEDAGRADIVDLSEIFEDVEDDVLDYEIVGAPAEAGMQIENINILYLEPDQDFNLPNGAEITIVASDDEGLTAEECFILTINPVNDSPVVQNPIEDIVVDEDCGLVLIADLDEIFFDVDGDELTYRFDNDIEEMNMEINEDNILLIEPDFDFHLMEGIDITVRVEDADGEFTIDVFNLDIWPAGGREEGLRVMNPIEDVVVDEDCGQVDIVNLDEVFFDPEEDDLEYAIIESPDEVRMQIGNNNQLFFNPEPDFNTPEAVEIIILAQNMIESVEESFILIIIPVNDGPMVREPIDDIVLDQNPGLTEIADLDDVFFDVDDRNGQGLRCEIINDPDELNMEIDENNILIINPEEDFALPDGVVITIMAIDPEELSTEDSFWLSIIPQPAIIEVFPEELDFGEVIIGDEREIDVEISNVGGEILEIMGIISSDEVFGDWELERPIFIDPGEGIRISVVFQPDRVMEYDEALTIFSNDENNPEFVVQLFGIGLAPPPPEIVVNAMAFDFGEVLVNTERTLELQIGNDGFEDLIIEDIRIDNLVFSTNFENRLRIGREDIAIIEITFLPEEEDEYEGALTITSNDDEVIIVLAGTGVLDDELEPHFEFIETGVSHNIVVRSASLNGEILEFPDEVGVFTPDGVCAGAVIINDDREDFGISAWGDDPQTQEVEGFIREEQFSFRYWDFNNEIEIIPEIVNIEMGGINWEAGALSILSLEAEFVFEPTIRVEPEAVDFGDVVVGEVGTQELRIMNVGLRDLIVESIEINNGSFGADFEEEFILGRDEVELIEISFEPDDVDAYEAILIISSNNGGREGNEFEVELRGTGIEEQRPEPHFEFLETIVLQGIGIDSAELNGEPLEEFDEIAVFTPAELCAGAVVILEQNQLVIIAYGDDPRTEIVDGFRDGEQFSFRYWDFENQQEIEAEIDEIIEGQNGWRAGARTVVSLTAEINQGPMIVVEPGEIDFGEVNVGNRNTRLFEIRNDGDEDLIVENVICEDEVFWAEEADLNEWPDWPPWPPDGPNMSILVLNAEFNGELLQEDHWILIYTPEGILAGCEQVGEFPMGLTAWGENWGGEIFRNGDELEFRYWIDEEEREVFAEAEYIVGNGEWQANGFAVVNLNANNRFEPVDLDEPIILEPGDLAEIVVYFVPEQGIRYESELIIISNDFRGEEFIIPVFGVGIDNEPFVNEIEDVIVNEDAGRVDIADLDEIFIFPDEEDELDFSFDNAPEPVNMNIDENNVLFINPDANYNLPDGVNITVIAEDPDGGSLEDIFILTIVEINDPPFVWEPIEDRVFDADPGRVEIVDLNGVFIDIEGDELAFRVNGAPDELNMEVDENSVLSFEPEPGFSIPDGVDITIIADDGELSVETAFNLVILEPELIEQIIELEQGWGMISVNISPVEEFWRWDEGPDVILMLDQLRDENGDHHVNVFKDEDGRFYVPDWAFNNIMFWDLQEGYQINVDDDIAASWQGSPLSLDEEIEIEQGWNLVGYAPDFELDASAPDFYVLSPIIDNVLIAKNAAGQFMTPEFDFSNMPPWQPGQGYQVKVEDDVMFLYPPEQDEELAFVGFTPPSSPSASKGRTNMSTGSNMSVLLNHISGNNVKPGDRIEVTSSSGAIVGDGVLGYDNRCGLVVWGDDEYTETVDGLEDGEEFRLILTSGEGHLDIRVSEILVGSGLIYRTDEFTVLNVSVQPPLPEEFYMSSAFPNPFNTTTRISYGIPEDSEVSIGIYDIAGCLVKTLIFDNQSTGHYTVTWEANATATGVYLIRIEAGQFNRVTKVVLTR